MRQQIGEFEAFLEHVAESSDFRAQQSTSSWDKKIEIGLPMIARSFCDHPPWVVERTDELESLSEQLTVARAEAKGELQALAAEAAHL